MALQHRSSLRLGLILWAVVFLSPGCAYHKALPPESSLAVYTAQAAPGEAGQPWAPAFAAYGFGEAYNRIGRPTAQRNAAGGETVFVDPDQPTVYFMQRSFSTARGTYTNLIYRVHFPEVPFSLIPFNITAGDNGGLLVVVTLNAEQHPVLITSVHTCGCYKAMVPTQYLPPDALPKEWSGRPLDVYGEQLPPLVDYGRAAAPQLLLHLRPEVLRVIPMAVAPMEALNRIAEDGSTTSFYHESGLLKGHVKDALKPMEMLFLSWLSLDLFVGMDKAYADPAVTGNPFYTSLKPWRRSDSNMWDFARFLHYWGWRL
jgi:hypothetical protein